MARVARSLYYAAKFAVDTYLGENEIVEHAAAAKRFKTAGEALRAGKRALNAQWDHRKVQAVKVTLTVSETAAS